MNIVTALKKRWNFTKNQMDNDIAFHMDPSIMDTNLTRHHGNAGVVTYMMPAQEF